MITHTYSIIINNIKNNNYHTQKIKFINSLNEKKNIPFSNTYYYK